MLVHRYLSHFQRPPSRPRVVTVGAYDGVHRGHQEILRRLKACGRASGMPALVLSFEPLPREFFSPDRPAARLTRFRERYRLLANLGVDELFCPPFRRIRRLSAGEFIEDVLLAGLGTRHVVVGEGFRFAANRLGTMRDLRAAGEAKGFGVTEVPAIYWRGRRVSSTAIRDALRKGDLAVARDMLGRDYSISGRVIRGPAWARNWDFPPPTSTFTAGRRPWTVFSPRASVVFQTGCWMGWPASARVRRSAVSSRCWRCSSLTSITTSTVGTSPCASFGGSEKSATTPTWLT